MVIDLRPEAADERHQRRGGLLERQDGEAALGQRGQRVALGQPGVDEAEELLLDAEDLAGPVHLLRADLRQPLPDLGTVHRRVEHGPALATGTGGHEDADALGDVLRHRGGALARLVVGMGVDGEQPELVGFGHPPIVPRPAAGRARPPAPPPNAQLVHPPGGNVPLSRAGPVRFRIPRPGRTCVHRRPTPVLAWPDRPAAVPDRGRPPESQEQPSCPPPLTRDQGVWLTQEAHDRLKAELDQLVAGRPAMSAEINARREEGDLKENGGYHAAKDEQGKQEARIRQLTDLLRKAQVGEPPATATNAALGTVITIKFAGDDETEKFLLGSREIAGTTGLGVYFPESALGAAIMGAEPGATVTYQAPNGRDMTVEVVGVEPFVP